jgi:hypothetical protein
LHRGMQNTASAQAVEETRGFAGCCSLADDEQPFVNPSKGRVADYPRTGLVADNLPPVEDANPSNRVLRSQDHASCPPECMSKWKRNLLKFCARQMA